MVFFILLMCQRFTHLRFDFVDLLSNKALIYDHEWN